MNQLAANQVVIEARAARLPTFFGSVTGAGALSNSRIGAGALNNSIIYDRLAAGFTGSQIITDFGRTSNLAESATLPSQGQGESVKATRAEILVQVDRAYFAALRAQSVTRVAQQTVDARQTSVEQVSALTQSKLKSELDLSFANVNLSEAKLLLIGAQNEIRATFADLSMALGFPAPRTFVLADEPLPPALDPDPATLGERGAERKTRSLAAPNRRRSGPAIRRSASAICPGPLLRRWELSAICRRTSASCRTATAQSASM